MNDKNLQGWDRKQKEALDRIDNYFFKAQEKLDEAEKKKTCWFCESDPGSPTAAKVITVTARRDEYITGSGSQMYKHKKDWSAYIARCESCKNVEILTTVVVAVIIVSVVIIDLILSGSFGYDNSGHLLGNYYQYLINKWEGGAYWLHVILLFFVGGIILQLAMTPVFELIFRGKILKSPAAHPRYKLLIEAKRRFVEEENKKIPKMKNRWS